MEGVFHQQGFIGSVLVLGRVRRAADSSSVQTSSLIRRPRGSQSPARLLLLLGLLVLAAKTTFRLGIQFIAFMARSLSRIILKGISESSCAFRSVIALDSFNRQCVKYSTTTNDSATHGDFHPTRKLEGDNLKDIVEQDIKDNPIMIYMKGMPDAPRCGFSALAVSILKEYGIPFSARNILEDHELKGSIKAVSNWPTFPQIFIKGEFIGGSDIVRSMHQSGELGEKLKGISLPPKETS